MELYINWNPSVTTIFGLRWYGLCWLLGLLGAYLIVKKLYKHQGLKDSLFEPLFYYCFFGVIVGAPSATWVLPRILFSGGESGIRTHGCFHIAGFQDRCFRPLSHLSVCKSVSRAKREYYITMYRRLCQQKAAEEI